MKKENKAPYGPSGHFPQRGKIKGRQIFPLWGKYPRSGGRGFFLKQSPHPSGLEAPNPLDYVHGSCTPYPR